MIPEIVIESGELLRLIQTRIDLLFTMSDITHGAVHPDKRVRSDVSRTIILGQHIRVGSGPVFALSSYDVAAFATIRLA